MRVRHKAVHAKFLLSLLLSEINSETSRPAPMSAPMPPSQWQLPLLLHAARESVASPSFHWAACSGNCHCDGGVGADVGAGVAVSESVSDNHIEKRTH